MFVVHQTYSFEKKKTYHKSSEGAADNMHRDPIVDGPRKDLFLGYLYNIHADDVHVHAVQEMRDALLCLTHPLGCIVSWHDFGVESDAVTIWEGMVSS